MFTIALSWQRECSPSETNCCEPRKPTVISPQYGTYVCASVGVQPWCHFPSEGWAYPIMSGAMPTGRPWNACAHMRDYECLSVHLHRPCTCVCKVTGYAAELYPALSTQYLNLMRGEKVNGEQRVITGSLRRVNVWVSQVVQRGQKDEVSKVHYIYIYGFSYMEQKHIVAFWIFWCEKKKTYRKEEALLGGRAVVMCKNIRKEQPQCSLLCCALQTTKNQYRVPLFLSAH